MSFGTHSVLETGISILEKEECDEEAADLIVGGIREKENKCGKVVSC